MMMICSSASTISTDDALLLTASTLIESETK